MHFLAMFFVLFGLCFDLGLKLFGLIACGVFCFICRYFILRSAVFVNVCTEVLPICDSYFIYFSFVFGPGLLFGVVPLFVSHNLFEIFAFVH